MNLINILKQGKVFAIVGSKHSGKTTTLFNFINSVENTKTNKYVFCYHQETKLLLKNKGLSFFDTLEELEQINNSFIFIDEFHLLFNIEDRHNNDIIKKIFNQLEHNNNIVILAGTTEYYNKLICSLIPDNNYILCKILFKDFIQGSQLKKYVLSLGTNLKGGTMLNLKIGEAFYKGEVLKIQYNKSLDKKHNRINLFEVKKCIK